MRSSLSSQLVWTLLVFMMVAFSLPAERPSAMAEAGAPAPRVTVARPIAKTIDVWDEYTGRFEALKQVEVRARVSGTLDKINFTDGQLVKEGDLLFVIDPRPYQIAVESAKADVTKAQAQVELAATDASRAQQLAESRTITLREVDQRKANLDVAKAQQLAPKRPCATPSSISNGRKCARPFPAASRTTGSMPAISSKAVRRARRC